MVWVHNVTKMFRLYRRPSDRVLELFPLYPRRHHTDFWALRNVSLTAPPAAAFSRSPPEHPRAYVNADEPNTFAPKEKPIPTGPALSWRFPAASVSAVELNLARA